jgi:hypothetical protein
VYLTWPDRRTYILIWKKLGLQELASHKKFGNNIDFGTYVVIEDNKNSETCNVKVPT